MFKFFKKIFFILILIGLLFVLAKFKYNKNATNPNDFTQQGIEFLKVIGSNLQKYGEGIFKDKKRVVNKNNNNGYELKTLTSEKWANLLEEDRQNFEGTEDSIITLINKERFDKGIKPLKKSAELMISAKKKAEDMQKNQYFEHISKQKIQPWFFAETSGYSYKKFGENIALDYLSANSVHKAFMDSIGHRANILDEDFQDVGVAIFPMKKNGELKYIVVEHFGQKLKKIEVEKREKYSEKSKKKCRFQKNKKKEIKKMIKQQKKLIEEFKIEINKKAIEEETLRLDNLNKIKEQINEYLDDCKTLRMKFK